MLLRGFLFLGSHMYWSYSLVAFGFLSCLEKIFIFSSLVFLVQTFLGLILWDYSSKNYRDFD